MNTTLKEFYKANFPGDPCADNMRPWPTFADLLAELDLNPDGVYNLIGEADSFIRETLFGELARLLGTDYDAIYRLWIRA